MERTFGWMGRILRVDLTELKTQEEDTMPYAQGFIGGRGIAARIAWEELKPGIDAFDPENRLIFMTGPLTGTLAPSSGRLTVGSVAPQRYPVPRYSRSGMGGRWPSELKYAGYDGIIIQGRAEFPVYLWIWDGHVEIRDASNLWGLGIYATIRSLMNIHGDDVRVACIGPAGERLVRIAVIQNDSESAAGQGGFGAVMGSKRLKAIVLRGSGGVRVADPEVFLRLCLSADRRGLLPPRASPPKATASPWERVHACSLACRGYCVTVFRKNVPGKVYPSLNSGQCHCFGFGAPSKEEEFEVRVALSNYGLNGFEVPYGIARWLSMCRKAGLIKEIDGEPVPSSIDSKTPSRFWLTLMRKITYREDIGDVLAEGTPRAAERLFDGKGRPFLKEIYPGAPEAPLGQVGHWDGHGSWAGAPPFPHWLVSVLIWTFDTRDPGSDTLHAFTNRVSSWPMERGGILTKADLRELGKRIYGHEGALDPEVSYEPPVAKVLPAFWHTNRACAVSSLVLCEQFYPQLMSEKTDDYCGDLALESKLLSAAIGKDISMTELDRIGERIFNLERAIEVRYGRTRTEDERMIPYYEAPDDKGIVLDREKYLRLMDEYYRIRGWDPKTGIPRREKLEELGLKDVAQELEARGLLA
ncbi:MAG: aldehyde ferredoxin oxidoreductase N-terminal domain-containing protein [Candidatus Bathyarchaeia archaeon]